MRSKNMLSMKSLLGEHRKSTANNALACVDAFEFITGKDYMNEVLFPFQRVVIKTLYGLWPKYPPDEEEQRFIDLEKQNWGITIDLNRRDSVQNLVLAAGRRASKTTISSCIAVYSLYKLIGLGDPQKHYHLRPRQQVHVMHLACKEDQAKNMYEMTRNKILRMKFFEPYIDPHKNNSGELKLFTPRDIEVNKVIARENCNRREGEPQKLLGGSLTLESVASVSTTNRGYSVYLLILSEFAHVQRSGLDDTKLSDHALYVALEPSLKDFGCDGKILMESSPKERNGEFYRHYCLGGGMEQENAIDVKPETSYQVIQAASWEANPQRKREEYDLNFRTDFISASMEYGAHFGEIAQQYVSHGELERLVDRNRPFHYTNDNNFQYVFGVDAGGRAKSLDGDAYTMAWAHLENSSGVFVVDGIREYRSKLLTMPDGKMEWNLVDPQVVTRDLVATANGLGGKDRILEVAYDQYDSGMATSVLKSQGFRANQIPFTNEYKTEMFSCFYQLMQTAKVVVCWDGPNGIAERFLKELRVFQREQRGDKTYYHHPYSGAIQHDDLVCAVAHALYRLWIWGTDRQRYVKEITGNGGPPVKLSICRPAKLNHHRPGDIPEKLKGRLR
jgi:hypothetical protein